MTLNRLARAAIAGGLGLTMAGCSGSPAANPPINATTYMSPGQMEELGPQEVQRLSREDAPRRSTIWAEASSTFSLASWIWRLCSWA